MQVVGLVREVRAEVQTLAGTALESLAEIQGTARYVNDSVVRPVSTVAAWVAAARATLRAFTEPLYKRDS
jgi:hypothetical protein